MAYSGSPHGHICGLYYTLPHTLPHTDIWSNPRTAPRRYLAPVSLSAQTVIISSTARTTLTQTFTNPNSDAIKELRYSFPLYDGVSVVAFQIIINKDRVMHGVVQEKAEARQTYQAGVAKGETAALLEQRPSARDVFITTIGNIPAGAYIQVELTYLGELKHDAEVDGLRFTLPTHIAPRYGSYPGELASWNHVNNTSGSGMSILVDVKMPKGCAIESVQSPSHPIAVSIGKTSTSTSTSTSAEPSFTRASATLSLGTTELEKDFVLHVVAPVTSEPTAVLETHPRLPNHRALAVSLVPRFKLPSNKPEVVFLCDRSGSMGGYKIENLKAALRILLRSLPVGAKFDICSFGSQHSFLFSGQVKTTRALFGDNPITGPGASKTYDAATLAEAEAHVNTFDANYGGTEIYRALEATFQRRHADMELEVILLTDGEVWAQDALIGMVDRYVRESGGAIRVFTLGIGRDVSHAIVEGVARAGNGFAQLVGDNEKMNDKVVRMLRAALSPHVNDYCLEVVYGHEKTKKAVAEKEEGEIVDEDDFERVEKVMDALTIDVEKPTEEPNTTQKNPISLFDASDNANPDVPLDDASLDMAAAGKFSHVPALTPPSLLQAPHNMPPLYAFNRTTAYVLMAPESDQGTPVAVILRGTSKHGPLELRVPVTVLTTPGESIHQLAARKAVRELEDGKGWVFEAKDKEDGKKLKDKYPGRFEDMVQREAVRLGTKFQVAGKWTSFVAVDEANGERAKGSEVKAVEMEREKGAEDAIRNRRVFTSRHAWGDGRGAGVSKKKMASSATSGQNASAMDKRLMGRSYQCSRSYRAPAAPVPRPNLSDAFGATPSGRMAQPPQSSQSPPIHGHAATMAPFQCQRQSASHGSESQSRLLSSFLPQLSVGDTHTLSLDTAFHAPAIPSGALFGNGNTPEPAPSTAFGSIAPSPHTRAVNLFGQNATATTAFGSCNNAPNPFAQQPLDPLPSPTSFSTLDPLEALISLQAFNGPWPWGHRVLGVLGLDRAAADQKAKELGESNPPSDAFATALVLCYLDAHQKERESEWGLLAEKAREWLREELGGEEESVEKCLERATVVLEQC